jgi:putative acetyltransferase
VHLRRYRDGDAPLLAVLYRDSVLGLGPTAYDPGQVRVWASFPDDAAAFQALLERGGTWVLEHDGEPAAFGQLYPVDHVSLLYTGTRFVRRGFATAVHRLLEDEARAGGVARLTTNASRISRPFFERAGYLVREREIVDRGGVAFERFRMEKRLA